MNDIRTDGVRPQLKTGEKGRLDSWKKIAAHFNRDVTTVQRWERRESMPVHRHRHEKQGSVYAYRSELDAWWASRGTRLATGADNEGPEPEQISVPSRRSGSARPALIAAGILIACGALI